MAEGARHQRERTVRVLLLLGAWITLQLCRGTLLHWGTGFSCGTSLVARRHVLWGSRSQTSRGTSVTAATTSSLHSSLPSSYTQPAPHSLRGRRSHLVSPTASPSPSLE